MKYDHKATPHAHPALRHQRLLAVLPPLLGALALTWLFAWSWPAPLPPLDHAPPDLGIPRAKAKAHASWEDASLEDRQRHYWPMVRQLSRRESVDPVLVMAVVQVESAFSPDANSRRGAKGLMQINRHTARHLGLHNPRDPVANLSAGIRYLAELHRVFSRDTSLALAAYNAGPTRVRAAGTIPDIEETREFVEQVLEQTNLFRNQVKHWN